jgi:hypothetical protein
MRLNETKSGINEIGIGLRISGRTSTHTSDKRFDRRTDRRPAAADQLIVNLAIGVDACCASKGPTLHLQGEIWPLVTCKLSLLASS